MSHLTTIKSTFKDIALLTQAVAALGQTLTKGGRARYWSGQSQDCDYLVKLPGKYDVGFVEDKKEECFNVVADSEVLANRPGLASDAHRIFGPGLKFLHQEYTAAVLERDAAIAGHTVTREKLKDGRLQLRVTGY